MAKYERLLFFFECYDRGDRIKTKGGYYPNENDKIIYKNINFIKLIRCKVN